MRPFHRLLLTSLFIAGASIAAAQDATTVQIPAFVLPESNQLSEEARAVLARMEEARAPDLKGDIKRQREFYGRYNDDRLAEMRRSFATREERTTLGGVPVHIVTPGVGPSRANAARVLINVHGGAFMWGSGSGALVEAIPLAATMGVKVVTVDYRLAPEHRYPAASQDVTAVYRALLKTYRPENVGIYGCSAGGVITAQSVAWIRREGLPRPGAIATLCGTGAPYSGDSIILSGPLGGNAPTVSGPLPDVLPTSYMSGVAASDGAAYPLLSETETAAFPPTLMLAGGRDFAASALTLAHRRLAAAHVRSELYLFDGLPHAFFVWPDMPESHEAYRVIANFFDRHLGKRKR
ncbi:alpha/beta hydrolase [Sphingopyxis sp.]|uniref:alpha/beta hydrolase n=1 Tax=Sphingopyxis sp. TaxID=1908224 RepID=UPI002D7ED925|nr:alpha/beta hydrolase fold domain-containing protein [Sphingopyxis sp.]